MAIPRKIRSRGAEAVVRFMQIDPDYFALGGGRGVEGEPGYKPMRIFRAPYAEIATAVPMAPAPRQYHVYNGPAIKEQDTGTAWRRVFVVIVECYSPLHEATPALGDPVIDDELDELADRLYRGSAVSEDPAAVPPPGRLRDPDDPERYITLGIEQTTIKGPAINHNQSAIRRTLEVTFFTREDAEGNRR